MQRLTGYEVEANVPIFNDHSLGEFGGALTEKGRNNYTETIGVFLSGGLKYGLNYGEDLKGHFTISADHNKLRTAHRGLIDRLLITGYLSSEFVHREMSNIEYITPPRDELRPGSQAVHDADILAVRKHHQQALQTAQVKKVGKLPPPAINLFTGVPWSEFEKWIDPKDQSFIMQALGEFENLITDQLYVQETSGVLPEDIPKVYAESVSEIASDGGGKERRAAVEILRHSQVIGHSAYDQTRGATVWTKEFEQSGAALVGYLTMVASYILAESLAQTDIRPKGSTPKNLFALFPRAELHNALAALPENVRPVDSNRAVWKQLVTALEVAAKPYGVDYWVQHYGVNVREEPLGFQGVFLMVGEPDELLEDLVQGKAIQSSGGKELSLDTLHERVATATGQQGIPLEDRYIKGKEPGAITSKNVGDVIAKRFNRATTRNVEHVPKEHQAEILKTVQDAPPLSQVIALQAEHLTGLFDKMDEMQVKSIGLAQELDPTSMSDQEIKKRLARADKAKTRMEAIRTGPDESVQHAELSDLEQGLGEELVVLRPEILKHWNRSREGDVTLKAGGSITRLLLSESKKIASGDQNLENVRLDDMADVDQRAKLASDIQKCIDLRKSFVEKAKLLTGLTPEVANEPGRVAALWMPMSEAASQYDKEAAQIYSVFEKSAKQQ